MKEGAGGFEKIYQFEKTLVVLKMYHKTTKQQITMFIDL
jgi:hypothetical protein